MVNDKSSNSCEHSAWRRAGPLPCTRDIVQHPAAFQMLEGVVKLLCARGRENYDINDSVRSTIITNIVRVACRNSLNPTAEMYSCEHLDCDAMIVRMNEKVVASTKFAPFYNWTIAFDVSNELKGNNWDAFVLVDIPNKLRSKKKRGTLHSACPFGIITVCGVK